MKTYRKLNPLCLKLRLMEMLQTGNTEINKRDVQSVDAGEFCKNECVCVSSLQRRVAELNQMQQPFPFFKFQI